MTFRELIGGWWHRDRVVFTLTWRLVSCTWAASQPVALSVPSNEHMYQGLRVRAINHYCNKARELAWRLTGCQKQDYVTIDPAYMPQMYKCT